MRIFILFAPYSLACQTNLYIYVYIYVILLYFQLVPDWGLTSWLKHFDVVIHCQKSLKAQVNFSNALNPHRWQLH